MNFVVCCFKKKSPSKIMLFGINKIILWSPNEKFQFCEVFSSPIQVFRSPLHSTLCRNWQLITLKNEKNKIMNTKPLRLLRGFKCMETLCVTQSLFFAFFTSTLLLTTIIKNNNNMSNMFSVIFLPHELKISKTYDVLSSLRHPQ